MGEGLTPELILRVALLGQRGLCIRRGLSFDSSVVRWFLGALWPRLLLDRRKIRMPMKIVRIPSSLKPSDRTAFSNRVKYVPVSL